MEKKHSFLIFLITFSVYFFPWYFLNKAKINELAIQSEDTIPAVFLPLTILKEKTLYLDTYYSQMLEKYPHPDDKDYQKGLLPFYLRETNGHYLSAFPIITPLLGLPIYFFMLALNLPIDWKNLALFSHMSGAFIMSLAVVSFYYLFRSTLSAKKSYSYLLTFIYAFCTINFAHISQAMWQHGTVQLFSTLGLIFLFKSIAVRNLKFDFLFGFFSGLAVLSRPTALLSSGIMFLFYLRQKYKSKELSLKVIIVYSIGFLLNVLFFLWYNNTFYQNISNQGYSNQIFRNWLGGFPLSFLGVWLSPSKGILVYSPIFILLLASMYKLLKNRSLDNSKYCMFAAVIFFHTLIISFWKHWFGGWSFGYRMSSDVLNFLVLLLLPVLDTFLSVSYRKITYFLLTVSFFIQVMGLVFFDGVWHAAYDKGFTDTSWLWSIKDSEIAFNIRRVLVKMDFIDKACDQCNTQ